MSTLMRAAVRGRRPGGRRKGQKGQALIIFGLMFVFLIGIVGLATDGAVAYAYSVSLERAASAAALAGAPYMPNYLGTATTRALDEATRNGWTNGGLTSIVVSPAGTRQLSVKITTTVPTFFMAALGVRSIAVSRQAIAGYLPPIPLGQPGFQLGSSVSQLGGPNQFYFMRFKAYNKIRSEGDPWTPNLLDSSNQPTAATDVHAISSKQGNEAPIVNNGSDPTCGGALGALALPCRGGQNYRVTIPAGTRGIIQIYNAAFAPEFGTLATCENHVQAPAALPPAFDQCGNGYDIKEGVGDGMGGNDPKPDNGPTGNGARLADAHCGTRFGATSCAGNAAGSNPATPRQQLYNAAGYSVFAAPNVFVRTSDDLLTQTKVLPVDATNWDGRSGPGNRPTYVNVATGNDITQCYDASGNPINMKVFHAWTNIVTEDGSGPAGCSDGDSTLPFPNNIVRRTQTSGPYTDGTRYTDYVSPVDGSLGPGTYRVRVDSLLANGSIGNGGDASKGYAIRVVDPAIPNAGCVGGGGVACTVAGWEDMTMYTPIQGAGGSIPLFQLPKEYAGQTIEVDAFDVGDAGGNLELSITDPVSGATAQTGSCAAGTGSVAGVSGDPLNVFLLGINRFPPVVGHRGPQFPDVPAATGQTVNQPGGSGIFGNDQAGEESTTGGTANFQGSWVRFEIPICSTYSANAYWNINYNWNACPCGSNDTFAFAVGIKGGPLHLISS